MTIVINWSPSAEPDIASYDVEFTPSLSPVAWSLRVNIPHDLLGPNYNVDTSLFFYADMLGDNTTYYRLIAIDQVGNRSAPSTMFQANGAAPTIDNNVRVDHNYPTPANLRYQTGSGAPIENAVVRIFKKADFDQGLTSTALATTQTNARGEWASPIFLTTGFTYTIVFAREGLYGPDTREIVV